MMEQAYITNIHIHSVRHLKNIDIELDSEQMKHLIITGKNGSGKTSLLDELSKVFNEMNYMDFDINTSNMKELYLGITDYGRNNFIPNLKVKFNIRNNELMSRMHQGLFIKAYYKADRIFKTEVSNHVENIKLSDNYKIFEEPKVLFQKYLVDLKVKQALFQTNGKQEQADQIKCWFNSLEALLKTIFEDESLSLVFNEEEFQFSIHMKNREPFTFNTLSSGYASLLDIVIDLIMRMEKHTNRSFRYDMPGIVFIDEIETHLHLDMQKNILKFLTTLFPNIQFIVSTHSPFVLNSISDVIIYDLENRTHVKNGLANIPYEGVVEGYFKVDTLSNELNDKFKQYKRLVKKEKLTDQDFAEIARLSIYLDEIPDYLALGFTTEYERLKLEFERRTDLND